jgi:molybdopterin synthase catalytic subunit
VAPSRQGDDWLALTTEELPVAAAYDWAVLPHCGAVVLFSGTVRDHAEGRSGVTHLDYEAYEEQVLPRLASIAVELRQRWPEVGRVALLHRVGRLELGASSVLVVVSAPHRPEAFLAARFGIDALKASAPIWKRESWDGGEQWGLGAHDLVDPGEVPTEQAEVEATWTPSSS